MAKGEKTCKSCGAIVKGPRTKKCPACGVELIQSMKYSMNGEIKSVQQSIKTEDGTVISPPTKRVGRPKTNVQPSNSLKDFDWHTLEKGDIIKVSQGDGTSWITNEGHEVPMGDNGNFRVMSHDANSIICWGLGKKSGTYMIWMGPETKTESGLIRKPHKILKVKKFIKPIDEENNDEN